MTATKHPTCKTCKHWEADGDGLGEGIEDAHMCARIPYISDATHYGSRPVPKDDLAWLGDYGSLYSVPDFYCAHHEEANKP